MRGEEGSREDAKGYRIREEVFFAALRPGVRLKKKALAKTLRGKEEESKQGKMAFFAALRLGVRVEKALAKTLRR